MISAILNTVAVIALSLGLFFANRELINLRAKHVQLEALIELISDRNLERTEDSQEKLEERIATLERELDVIRFTLGFKHP